MLTNNSSVDEIKELILNLCLHHSSSPKCSAFSTDHDYYSGINDLAANQAFVVVMWLACNSLGVLNAFLTRQVFFEAGYDILIHRLTLDMFFLLVPGLFVCNTLAAARLLLGPLRPSLAKLYAFAGDAVHFLGFNSSLQIVFVRFLYTNVWRNIGTGHDDFWVRFLRVFNPASAVWLAATKGLSNTPAEETFLALFAGVHPETLPSLYGETVSIPWLEIRWYDLSVLLLILVFNSLSRREAKLQNRRFLERCGRNSRFAQHHSLRQWKLYHAVGIVYLASLGLMAAGLNHFRPEDYKTFPGSTFLTLFTFWIVFLFEVVGPISALYSDLKLRRATKRVLKEWLTGFSGIS